MNWTRAKKPNPKPAPSSTEVWHIEEWVAPLKGKVSRVLPAPDLKYRFARRIEDGVTHEILQAVRTDGVVKWMHTPWCQCIDCITERKQHPHLRDRRARFDNRWN